LKKCNWVINTHNKHILCWTMQYTLEELKQKLIKQKENIKERK